MIWFVIWTNYNSQVSERYLKILLKEYGSANNRYFTIATMLRSTAILAAFELLQFDGLCFHQSEHLDFSNFKTVI